MPARFKYIALLAGLLFFASAWGGQTGARYHFDHLSMESGMPLNFTNCILQDHVGYMWFGTRFGLVRYDGQRYRIFRSDPQDSTSLSADEILCLFEDRKGYLWIGTRGGGLNIYPPHSKRFIIARHDKNNPSSLSDNTVTKICEDSSGSIWIGTMRGLNRVDSKSLAAYGEEIAPSLHFTRYLNDLTDNRSLSDNIVNDMAVDSRGTLWIATQNGLSRYEQKSRDFQRYFHYNPYYTRIYNKKLYALIDSLKKQQRRLAAIEKIGHYADAGVKFTITKQTRVFLRAMGEGRSEFRGLPVEYLSDYGWLERVSDGKILWKMKFPKTMYAGGAEKNREQMAVISLPPGEYKLRYKSDDSHSFAGWNNFPPARAEEWGIQAYRLSVNQVSKTRQLIASPIALDLNSLSSNILTMIKNCQDPDILWIGTADAGLNRFNIKEESFIHFRHDPDDHNTLPDNHILSLFLDDSCKLWIGTPSGLSVLDYQNNQLENIRYHQFSPSGLSGNYIREIYRDRSGLLWFSCFWNGIDKLSPFKQIFTQYIPPIEDASQVALKNVFTICGSDHSEDIWLGSVGGLKRLNLETDQFEEPFELSALNKIIGNKFIRTLIRDRDDGFWFGTFRDGLFHFSAAEGILRQYRYDNKSPTSLSSDNIVSLFQDDRDRIWIGTADGGLNLLDNDRRSIIRFRHHPGDSASLPADEIYTIRQDKRGNIWVGTSGGLGLFDERRGKFKIFRYDPGIVKSISSNKVYVIFQPKNQLTDVLWIGTASGLNQFTPATGEFTRLGEANGLPNRMVCAILEDEKGMLWISTNRGLSQFDPITRVFINYDISDGLQSNMFNVGAAYEHPSGSLIFGGINGISLFKPATLRRNEQEAPVIITDFRVFDAARPFENNTETPIRLSYWDNFFSFDFASLDFHKPERIQYAYMLQGVDERWVHSGNRNSVSYTNIDPGKYLFRVRGTNSDGVWNLDGAAVQIIIAPPFWQTWWFRGGSVILILAITGWIIFAIIRREKHKEQLNRKLMEIKLKALRAQMNPHFIFNTLNSIQYFIVNNEQKSAMHYLSLFSKLLRKTLDNAEKPRIPLSEEIESIRLYLELQKLRFEGLFTYSIQYDKTLDIENIDIPTMLIQPFVENAIHHGLVRQKDRGHISLKIIKKNNILSCRIEDNGIGIDSSIQAKTGKQAEHVSRGISLTRERLRSLNRESEGNARLTIRDMGKNGNGKHGTRVVLNVPIS